MFSKKVLHPQNCTVCGVEYVPGSGVSKYCPVCARKVRLERSNESRRRSREQKRTVCIELSAKNDRLWDNLRYGNAWWVAKPMNQSLLRFKLYPLVDVGKGQSESSYAVRHNGNAHSIRSLDRERGDPRAPCLILLTYKLDAVDTHKVDSVGLIIGQYQYVAYGAQQSNPLEH